MNNKIYCFYPEKEILNTSLLNSIFNLNELNKPALGQIDDLDHLKKLYKSSLFCLCTYNEDQLTSFTLVMDENSDYQSPNYLFFKIKFSKFLYVDRIAVSDGFQRLGIGSISYNFIYELAQKEKLPFCCEVNTVPLNQQSLDFHKKNGFEVLEEISFGKKTVAMLVKYSK